MLGRWISFQLSGRRGPYKFYRLQWSSSCTRACPRYSENDVLDSHSPHLVHIPNCFPLDLMHLVSLNIPDLLLSLWRGTLYHEKNDDKSTWDWAVLRGDIWKDHGKVVASTTPQLPGSFDRPPRNPAEKMSSGYKAWKFLL